MASNRVDISNQYFGRLKTLFYFSTSATRKTMWFCECLCGGFKVIDGASLKRGLTKSCGCIQKERQHPLCGTRLHRIWKNMKTRCYLKSKNDYPYYGGRGIRVCKEWHDFAPFAEWAMSHGYEDHLTLDRKNSNCNYEPDNCRWVTRQRQSNNIKTNRIIEVEGVSKTLADWGRFLNRDTKMISNRILNGWKQNEAVMVPRIPFSKKGAEKELFKQQAILQYKLAQSGERGRLASHTEAA
jgi:hypothetical protein